MKTLIRVILLSLVVILLASCSVQGGITPPTTETVKPSATISVEPTPTAPTVTSSPVPSVTPTPILTTTPTINPESIFIVPDEAWAGAKEDVTPEGDWVASGYVYVEPGYKITSPADGMVAFNIIPGKGGYIIFSIKEDRSDNPEDIMSSGSNYPICFGAADITPLVEQYAMVKAGDEIGIVNSTGFGPPEKQKDTSFELYGYNLSIFCPINMTEYGMKEPFPDEMTLREKIEFIVNLAKKSLQ